jgi:hypothetical protein
VKEGEASIVGDADARASAYLRTVLTRRVYPDPAALRALSGFDEALSETGRPDFETLKMLDDHWIASNRDHD